MSTIDAALDIYEGTGWRDLDPMAQQRLREKLEAAIAALRQPEGVKVRGLEWQTAGAGSIAATTIVGVYAAHSYGAYLNGKLLDRSGDTVDANMVVCQVDYERRIRSDLEPAALSFDAKANLDRTLNECAIPSAEEVTASAAALSGQEAVAWRERDGDHWYYYDSDSDTGRHIRDYQKDAHGVHVFPLYASPVAEGWRPTHRHIKTGGEYMLLGVGKMQASDWKARHPVFAEGLESVNMREVAIYVGKDGHHWVRPREEFEDGRFVPLPSAPKEGT